MVDYKKYLRQTMLHNNVNQTIIMHFQTLHEVCFMKDTYRIYFLGGKEVILIFKIENLFGRWRVG